MTLGPWGEKTTRRFEEDGAASFGDECWTSFGGEKSFFFGGRRAVRDAPRPFWRAASAASLYQLRGGYGKGDAGPWYAGRFHGCGARRFVRLDHFCSGRSRGARGRASVDRLAHVH